MEVTTICSPPLALANFSALRRSMQWHPIFTSSSWPIAAASALGFTTVMLRGYYPAVKLSLNSFLAFGSIGPG